MATQTVTMPVRLIADLPTVWRHHCGALNEGTADPSSGTAVCGACRADIRHDEVEARYLLVEVQV